MNDENKRLGCAFLLASAIIGLLMWGYVAYVLLP